MIIPHTNLLLSQGCDGKRPTLTLNKGKRISAGTGFDIVANSNGLGGHGSEALDGYDNSGPMGYIRIVQAQNTRESKKLSERLSSLVEKPIFDVDNSF